MSDQRHATPGSRFGVAPGPGMYLAADRGELIVLDVKRDRYLALDTRASHVARTALRGNIAYLSQEQQLILNALLRQGLLVRTPTANAAFYLPVPPDPRGVSSYSWMPYRSRAAQLGATSKMLDVVRSVRTLHLAETIRRRLGIAGLLTWLTERRAVRPRRKRRAHEQAVAAVVRAHLWARSLYPWQVHCLSGSAGLVTHLWHLGIMAEFVIGVQKYPFIAHAWVEFNCEVINDRVEVSSGLARIVSI
ncbi:lasso peptide biosynthesis B2 protein [Haloechinothrix sp. YIM 98757]|uniref:Lasso peptide biosynthesis B2 protein n=1 Tax=Haloechinothrix aidingensis TaxID=2752311 RepID=A0A838ACS6_9PSEU|nr:lasso peptide biosynthesis B2 protein [Haloechinothrix aidingensis]MBA0127017.1 lasso peptide biosynthesis B2 protein [Haloechinothrix aidingensis]